MGVLSCPIPLNMLLSVFQMPSCSHDFPLVHLVFQNWSTLQLLALGNQHPDPQESRVSLPQERYLHLYFSVTCFMSHLGNYQGCFSEHFSSTFSYNLSLSKVARSKQNDQICISRRQQSFGVSPIWYALHFISFIYCSSLTPERFCPRLPLPCNQSFKSAGSSPLHWVSSSQPKRRSCPSTHPQQPERADEGQFETHSVWLLPRLPYSIEKRDGCRSST